MREEAAPKEIYKYKFCSKKELFVFAVLSITIINLIAVFKHQYYPLPASDIIDNKINAGNANGNGDGVTVTDPNIIPISFKWRNLTPKELKEWYRPIDFCMLQSDSAVVSTKFHFISNCSRGISSSSSSSNGGWSNIYSGSSLSPRTTRRVDQGFCGPGMGSRGQCPSPLSSREFFFRALQGYDQASHRPLVDLAKALHAHQQDLIFIGDSHMRQNVLAFLCELQRESVTVKTSHIDASCHHVYTIRGHVQVLFLQIGRLYSVDKRCHTNLGGRNRTGPGSYTYAQAVVRERQRLKNSEGGVVVVANTGVWYNDPSLYEAEVTQMLQWLHSDIALTGAAGAALTEKKKSEGRGRGRAESQGESGSGSSGSGGRSRSLAVFLESFPQHIPVPNDKRRLASSSSFGCSGSRRSCSGSGGSGSSNSGSSNISSRSSKSSSQIIYSVPSSPQEILLAKQDNSCCVPITNYSRHADWRNRIVREVTSRNFYRSVSILPVAEAFKPAHNMHMCGRDSSDCTHYCFWPMQLQFEWHALAKIVKQQCVGGECRM